MYASLLAAAAQLTARETGHRVQHIMYDSIAVALAHSTEQSCAVLYDPHMNRDYGLVLAHAYLSSWADWFRTGVRVVLDKLCAASGADKAVWVIGNTDPLLITSTRGVCDRMSVLSGWESVCQSSAELCRGVYSVRVDASVHVYYLQGGGGVLLCAPTSRGGGVEHWCRVLEMSSEEEVYACSVCDKAFKSELALVQHIQAKIKLHCQQHVNLYKQLGYKHTHTAPAAADKKKKHKHYEPKKRADMLLVLDHYIKKPNNKTNTDTEEKQLPAHNLPTLNLQKHNYKKKKHTYNRQSVSSPEAIDTPLSSPNFESKTADELEIHNNSHRHRGNRALYLDKDTNQEEHYEEKPVGNHIYAQKFFSAGHSPSQKKHAHHPGPNIVLLTASLEEYAKQTLPSAQLESARTDLLNRLMNTVEHLYEGKVRMEVFGSCAANLSSKTSDLDVCLSFKENDSAHQDHEQLAILAKLDKRLREEDYGTPFTILSARVPIVKLTDTKTGIECDFAIRVGRHRLKSRFLQLLTKHDQRFRALVLAIKFWSKRRYVGDASRGTLNSFGHTLLIVHYLQACENPIFPVIELVKNDTREVVRFNSLEPLQCNEDDISWDENAFSNFEMKNHLSLGELLFGYFEYYATKFDPSQHIVSTHQKELIYSDTSQRKMLFQERQKSFFCVQDPVDLSDNVGRNMFHDAVVFVMREFRRAYKMLANGATFEQLCENPPEAPLLYQPQGYVTPQSGMKPKSESIYKESQSSNEVELKSSISTSVTVTTEKSLEDKEMKANGKSSS